MIYDYDYVYVYAIDQGVDSTSRLRSSIKR